MRAVGFVIFIVTIIGFIAYAYLLLVSEWSILVLKLTILGLIGLIAILLAFIGLNMALAKERS